MRREDGQPAQDEVDGLPTEEAVSVVVDRDGSPEPDSVRRALEQVTDDGVVSWEAADASVAHASKVVSTPETRIELAAIAIAEAREAAEPVADLDVVAVRLDDFEARLSALETRVEAVGEELQTVVQRCTERDGLFDVARGIQDVVDDANRVHGAADDLALEIEEFQQWLGSERVRVREFEEDVDAVDRSIAELAGAVEELAEATSGGDPADESGDADRPGPGSDADLGGRWFEAGLQARLLSLLVDDLRGERADLREWAERDGTDGDGWGDGLGERLDDLDARIGSIDDRLEAVAKPGWTDQFGSRLEAFESAADEFAPPVDWGEVQAELDRHRAEVGRGAGQP